MAGEPSSIIQATGGDTLRRNFQQIQEGRVAAMNLEAQQQLQQQQQQQAPQPNRSQKQLPQQPMKVEESRPALPQRLIVVPDPQQQSAAQPQQMPIQHAANRPLPPTPRSSSGSSGGSSSQAAQPQSGQASSGQRSSQPQQPQFKPMVDRRVVGLS